jgi:hypothetical protein
MTYEKVNSMDGESYTSILRSNEDGTISFIPIDPANSDYQTYLAEEEKAKETD